MPSDLFSLGEPQLKALARHLRGAPWEETRALLQMERQAHLESLADPGLSNDKFIYHRAVAFWVKEFIDRLEGYVFATEESLAREAGAEGSEESEEAAGSPYMEHTPAEFDS